MVVRQGISALLRRCLRDHHQQRWPNHYTVYRSFSAKLFVGGLSFRTVEEGVRSAFSAHGQVTDVRIVLDRETGKSKGFGFVTFESEADAETALSKMDGTAIDGRAVRVDRASARPPLSSRPVDGFSETGTPSPSPSPPPPPSSPQEEWGTILSNVVNVTPQAPPQSTAGGSPQVVGSPADVLRSPASPFDNSTLGATATTSPSSSLNTPSFDSSTFGAAVASPAAHSSSLGGKSGGSSPAGAAEPSGPLTQPAQTQFFSASSFGAAVSELPSRQSFSPAVQTIQTSAVSNSSGPAAAAQPLPGTAPISQAYSSDKATSTSVEGVSASLPDISKPAAFAGVSSSQTDTTKPAESSGTSSSSGSSMTTTSPISPAINSAGQFDFTNFPAFDSSSYQDEHSLPRRRTRPRPRAIPSTPSNFTSSFPSVDIKSPFGSASNLADTAIPKPKGPEFDFGLPESANTLPPTAHGAKPQGTFDIDIPEGTLQEPPPEPAPKPKPLTFSIFPQRTLPPLDLPWDTPEADNWSDIGEDPPKFDLSSIYAPLKTFIRKDKELFWDPYDYDEDAKLPPEPNSDEENAEEEAVVS